jgi:hypothetical protein
MAAAEPVAPALTREGMVVDAAESAVPRMVLALAVILPIGLLLQAVVDHTEYRHPLLPVVVWLAMLAAATWLAPRARADDLGTEEAAAAIAIAVVAVTAIGLDRRAQAATTTVDWTILGVIWLLALVALTSPARVWVPGAALVMGVHAVFILRLLGVNPLGLARLAGSVYAMAVILAIFAALRPALRTHAQMAARRSELGSRSAAERAKAAALHKDRRERLALLELEALPLLRGIAEGVLDPADPAVRRRCAQHAVTLRQALADRSRQAGGLLARLEPALSAARARDVPVEVQVIGDPGHPAEDVTQATVAAVDALLRTLPPQPVTLTVLRSGGEAELYLTFERAPRDRHEAVGPAHAVPAAAGWRASVEAEAAGRGCLEVHWRTAVPA